MNIIYRKLSLILKINKYWPNNETKIETIFIKDTHPKFRDKMKIEHTKP